MSVRPVWFAHDAMFLSDDSIKALIHYFGCPGPLVVTHLLGAAKIQNDAGRVRLSYKALVEYAALDRPLGAWWDKILPAPLLKKVCGHGDTLARDIIIGLASAEVGFFRQGSLADATILFENGFDAVIDDWWEWQFPTRPLTDAERQRARRARKKGNLVDLESGDIFDPENGEVLGSILDVSRDVSRNRHETRDTSVTPDSAISGDLAA